MARTIAIPDPGNLLARLPEHTSHAWIHHGDGIIAWGEAARTTVPPGPHRFAWARDWLARTIGDAFVDDDLRLPGTGPIAFGTFTFDPDAPGSVLTVPKAVLARRDGISWFTTIGPPAPALLAPPRQPGVITYSDGALTAPQWQHAVARAIARIKAGHLEKVVLARDLHAHTDIPIDIRLLLRRLAHRYPGCYTFTCAGLTGATPELLVRRTGRTVESLVLAGTIPRGSTPHDDTTRAAALMASPKDRHEHHCAIQSVRDALTPLCDDLTLPRTPQLLTLPNVVHLATPVRGRLADGASVLDVLAALHPTAAVGGTPTRAALALIKELEGMDRAGYAGPVGWIDSRGDGEWGIALRCAHIDGTHARLFAGCGIMADSDPAVELIEAQAKLRVMQYALEG